MPSYAEKHAIDDVRQCAEHMLANSDEWFLVIPNTDPELEGEYIASAVFPSNERLREVLSAVASDVGA